MGTGEGSFVLQLAKHTPKTQYDAVEVNAQLISRALKKKEKAKNKQVNFICSPFDQAFAKLNYNMIMARFAVEHMTNIPSFVNAAYSKLKRGGILAIIEYYIDAVDIDDPLWLQFRKKELALYKQITSHPRSTLRLPHDMKRAGFNNITSSLIHITPSTIGSDNFFDLAATYATSYALFNSKIWAAPFVKKVLAWCKTMRKNPKTDPAMFVSHTVGYKI